MFLKIVSEKLEAECEFSSLGRKELRKFDSFQIQILWLVAESSGRQGRVGRRSEGK